MDHGGSTESGDLLGGLCSLARDLRREQEDVYDIYSGALHNPLHDLMNRKLDEGSAIARRTIRAENALELALLSQRPVAVKLRLLGRVIDLAGRLMEVDPACRTATV